jgi:hypothetical protein
MSLLIVATTSTTISSCSLNVVVHSAASPPLSSLLMPTFIFGIAPAALPTSPASMFDWRPCQLCHSRDNRDDGSQCWGVFFKACVSKTVLGFEFAINNGGSQPTCCCKPSYGPHESKIILEQKQVLLANGWIWKCYGPWGSLVSLAPEPHQDNIFNINAFIRRIRVSHRKLNSVALPFEHPILR